MTERPPAYDIGKWLAIFCLLVIVAAYFYQVRFYWHYVNDDAYITLRYSRHLAMGHGPYFNVGEHVEGYVVNTP